jgi:hypothetical protein
MRFHPSRKQEDDIQYMSRKLLYARYIRDDDTPRDLYLTYIIASLKFFCHHTQCAVGDIVA